MQISNVKLCHKKPVTFKNHEVNRYVQPNSYSTMRSVQEAKESTVSSRIKAAVMVSEICPNEVLILVPFHYGIEGVGKTAALRLLHERAMEQTSWTRMSNEIKHMHRFISNRLTSTDSSERRCEHYVNDRDRDDSDYSIVSLQPERRSHSKPAIHSIRVHDTHLYAFQTGIGIAALRVSINDSGIEQFAQIHDELKRVDTTHLWRQDDSQDCSIFEFIESSIHELLEPFSVSYFFHQYDDSHRANSIVYYETRHEFEEDKELWLLCSYHRHHSYNPSADDAREKIKIAPDMVWRASTESAVCLVDPSFGRASFLRDYKERHFSIEHSFLYILVMHQKYALYQLMEQIDADALSSPERLQSFSKTLFKIETNYVFTNVSEVPHYQHLYALFSDAATIGGLIADIKEPITSLERIRTEENKAREEKSDKSLNNSLAVLALLGVISMLVDGCGLIDIIYMGLFGTLGLDIAPIPSANLLFVLQVFFMLVVILLLRRTIGRILRILKDK